MGKHEKPVSGTSRKSEARLPRAERTPSVREEELLFDIPETAERVTAHAAETLPEEPPLRPPRRALKLPPPFRRRALRRPPPSGEQRAPRRKRPRCAANAL